MRFARIALFLGIAIGILALGHFYVWRRLVADPSLPAPWDLIGTGATLALFFGTPASFAIPRLVPRPVAALLMWPLWTWMGVAFLLIVLLGAIDLVRLFVDVDARTAALAAGGATAALTATSVASALAPVRVREVRVPLDRLPPSLDGTTIVQLSDVHVDLLVGRRWLARIVRRVAEIDPAAVVITGDLVDGTVEQLRDDVAPLAELRPRWGTFFVTGNHEYYGRVTPIAAAEEWIAELERIGVRVLRNERVAIGEGDATIDIAGVYDASAASYGRAHRPDVARALEGRDPRRPVILLAHQPLAIRAAARHGVDLQLSGHTHDGQIWPFKYLVHLQQPYVEGLRRHEGTWLFVSRGTGFWGPPMRLFAPAEITKIVLEAKPRT